MLLNMSSDSRGPFSGRPADRTPPPVHELVTLADGRVYLLDRPGWKHIMDDRVLIGRGVDSRGTSTGEEHVLAASTIVTRVAMVMDDDLRMLVPAPSWVPFADQIH